MFTVCWTNESDEQIWQSVQTKKELKALLVEISKQCEYTKAEMEEWVRVFGATHNVIALWLDETDIEDIED